MQTVYWLVIFIVLLIIEIITMGLTTIWFALGALAAFLAGVFGFRHGGAGGRFPCGFHYSADPDKACRGEVF